MEADNKPLAGATLEIPPVGEYPWNEAANSSEGETRKLLFLCEEQAVLVKRFESHAATPEAVGWLTLWTRNWQQMQSVIALLQSEPAVTRGGQVFALELIWRSAFELYLQLLTIHGRGLPQVADEYLDVDQVLTRLNAYVAWSVYQDRGQAIKYSKAWRLDQAMDSAGAKAVEDNPEAIEIMKRLWGDESIVTELETNEKKRHLEDEAQMRVDAYRKWLKHPKLEIWYKRIESEPRPKDFFGLVSEAAPSIRNAMDKVFSTDVHYPIYQRASSIAHGTSIDEFLAYVSGHLMPNIVADEDRVQTSAAHVRRFCHFNSSSLAALLKIVSLHALDGTKT